jgi:hemerythrin
MNAPERTEKILVIDDDPSVTGYLAAKLGKLYLVIQVNDSTKAIAVAQTEHPDLVLCDVNMPGTDGYELCRRMKALDAISDAPFIFLTSTRTDAEDEEKGLACGAVDYLHKTQDRDVLEARVNTQIALRRARIALRDQNVLLETKVAERTAELEQSRALLREAMHNLRTTRVSAGVYWVQIPEAGLYILCGCPADVVKHLMLRGYIAEERTGGVECETGPNVILLSDVLVQNGRFSNLAEFPVLQMLYRQGMILPGHPNNTGRRPLLIGSESQVRAQLEYIYRGNYGLVSEEEMREAGLDAEEAARQMALKLRFAFGAIRPTEDLLDYRVIGDEAVDIGNGAKVSRIALNRYVFTYNDRGVEVDLNLPADESYESPYSPGHHQIEPQYFGVIHCGEGDGWDLRRQSMASVVMFQGRYYLVDAGPSVLYTLQALGIGISEIEGIFHTHAHDDHFAGLPTLMASGHRIKYFATPLVRHSVTKKLAALMSMNEQLFSDIFDVRDLVADHWNDCDGMEVMPVYSPHPVENNLFVFRVRDDENYKSYAHWADIVSMDVLRKLVTESPAREKLPADFVQTVHARYLTPVSLKKIDAGGGLIHGNPVDFRDDKSEKIVLAHRSTRFNPEELEIGSQANFGVVDVLIPSSQDYLRQNAYRHLMQIFPDATLDEMNALLRSPVVAYGAGSLIVRRDTEIRHVFLLLGGGVERSSSSGGPVQTLPTGSLIGVGTLFNEVEDGSWRATSPVRLLRMSVDTFRAFLLNGGWYGALRSERVDTAFLRGTPLFCDHLTFSDLGRIMRESRLLHVNVGEIADTGAPTLRLVHKGELKLLDGKGNTLEIVGPGGFVGESHCIGESAPPWHAVATAQSELMEIPPAEIRRYPVLLWKLLECYQRRLRAIEFRQAHASMAAGN